MPWQGHRVGERLRVAVGLASLNPWTDCLVASSPPPLSARALAGPGTPWASAWTCGVGWSSGPSTESMAGCCLITLACVLSLACLKPLQVRG